ncbi:MAG TPA: glycosyltransferase [Opitutus sp.]|nr:glycosyltransferase [Opitutus sp.]
MRPTLAFAGGYTAGHITPGLAVIEWLRDHGVAGDFLFLGAANGWERELVSRAGVPFAGLPPVPWAGRGALTRTLSLLRLVPAVAAARRHLRDTRVSSLVGLGSFASVAPALAARSLRIPVTLYEPNASLGLANRLLHRRARALLVSRLFERGQIGDASSVEVGVPLRASVLELSRSVPAAPTRGLRLLVLGGSRGNPFLNDRMPAVAARLHAAAPAFSLTHQCGHDVPPAALAVEYAGAGVLARVESYLDPIAVHLRAADFVVSAAGAITLHELAAAGVPALVVPLDSGGGAHQLRNAAAFARLTGCPIAMSRDWSAEAVAAEVSRTVHDHELWRRRQAALRTLAASGDPAAFARQALRPAPSAT